MNIAFETKLPADPQKLRGGYYTPEKVVEYLVDWAIRDGHERVLEPSCGDGNFVVAIANRLHALSSGDTQEYSCGVVAVEAEPSELAKAQGRVACSVGSAVPAEWIGGDFFRAYPMLSQSPVDVVLGNPPFIRFQHFIEESREIAFFHLRNAGYKPTKLANAWAAFVQLSIELLKPGGRLAMVLPAELLQVQYAGELRSRIVGSFDHIVLVGFKQLIFPEIQQEVVLLLAEGKRAEMGDDSHIHTIDISDASELSADVLENRISHAPVRHSRKGMKWTSLYLDAPSFDALDRAEHHKDLSRLGSLAKVEVGVVTGLNSFFVIDAERSRELGVDAFSTPVIGKTGGLKGLRLTAERYDVFREKFPSYLLNLSGISIDSFPKKLIQYIKQGEEVGANSGYKCRIRKRWFDVPSIYIPDAFLFRQIHAYPLMVVNEVRATSTDTIHRVRACDGVDIQKLAACFVNSLTFAWAEVAGRSYGGGVLELEPREAQALPVPYFSNLEIDMAHLDLLVRAGDIEAALDYGDKITLIGRLGFSVEETKVIRSAWHQLRDRRINRK